MTDRRIDALNRLLRSGPRLLLWTLAVVLPAMALSTSAARPLWYDELYTYYVAREPSIGAVFTALLAGADTNPPVDYLLRHLSLRAFGDTPIAFRLPSVLAFIVGLFAIHAYVRPRVSRTAAVAAFVLPVATLAAFYSIEGRAYALLFASAALALLAWQRAIELPRSPFRLLLLVAGLSVGPFTHYFGVLNYLPVVAGEAWRSVKRRQIDWPIAAAILASLLALPLLLLFAQNATAMKAGAWSADFGLRSVPVYYREFFADAVFPALCALIASALLWEKLGNATGDARPSTVPSWECLAAVVLAATPFSAFLLAKIVTGTLTTRYAIVVVPGVAMLLAYAVDRLHARRAGLAAFVVGVLAAASVLSYRQQLQRELVDRTNSDVLVPILARSALDVVFDDPQTFLRYQHVASEALQARLIYPMDPPTALALHGSNADEISLRALRQIRPLNIADYSDFVATHRRVLLVASPYQVRSLVPSLLRDGWRLELLEEYKGTMLMLAEDAVPR